MYLDLLGFDVDFDDLDLLGFDVDFDDVDLLGFGINLLFWERLKVNFI